MGEKSPLHFGGSGDGRRHAKALRLEPDAIRIELISHLHWDHWVGHALFPNAEFRIQKSEVAFWTGRRRPMTSISRQLVPPRAIQSWSLTNPQQRMLKTGGRLIRHARYYILQFPESQLTQSIFGQMLGRIERLSWHPS